MLLFNGTLYGLGWSMGIAGEPLAFGPAFRSIEPIAVEPTTAPALGADTELLIRAR